MLGVPINGQARGEGFENSQDKFNVNFGVDGEFSNITINEKGFGINCQEFLW